MDKESRNEVKTAACSSRASIVVVCVAVCVAVFVAVCVAVVLQCMFQWIRNHGIK